MNLSAGIPKKIARNCAASSQKRTEFVRANFPEALKCDPYQSPKIIAEVRAGMLANGFYNPGRYTSNIASDETIIRYILKAQKKPLLNSARKSQKQIVYGF